MTIHDYRKQRDHSIVTVPWSTRISSLKNMKIFEGGRESYPADKFTLSYNGKQVADDESSLLSIAGRNCLFLHGLPSHLTFEIDTIDITVEADDGSREWPMTIETEDLWKRDYNLIKGFVFGIEDIDTDDVTKIKFKSKVPGATAIVFY